jgi:hypothetical protein
MDPTEGRAVIAWCVESPVTAPDGRIGTARVYVATEQRAREVAALAPGRAIKRLEGDAVPEAARANLERAALEAVR